MSKAISEIFDVEVTETRMPLVDVQTDRASDAALSDVKSDAAFAQDNIKQLIEIGMESLREAAAVATTQESPRAYEVVSTMIRGLSDMNIQLLDIHAKKKAIQEENPKSQIGQTTNNAFFVGTTKDINEIIMKRLGKSNE